MSSYSFDEHDAKEYGVNEAIFLNSLRHWIRKNEVDNRNIDDDGNAWTYNTYEQYTLLFTWLSVDQVKRIITKLRDRGVIAISHAVDGKAFDRKNFIRPIDQAESPDVHQAESPDHARACFKEQIVPDSTLTRTSANDIDSDEEQTKRMTRGQRSFLRTLLSERGTDDDQEKLDYIKGMVEGTPVISSETASEYIQELDAMPRPKKDNGMVRCKLWNASNNWIDSIERDQYEYIRETIVVHNRERLNQPALFEVNGREMVLTAIAEFQGDGS